MAIFLIGEIRSLFTARGEMEDKKTSLQIPNPKEESKRRVIRSSLECSSTEPYFRWRLHLQVFSKGMTRGLLITNRNVGGIEPKRFPARILLIKGK